jgi:tRNA(Ile)-lysidine synthase
MQQGDSLIQPTDIPLLIKETGLLKPEGRVLVLISGGGDSVGLLSGIVALRPASQVIALHVNYGLRAESDADEAFCVALCESLDVELFTRKYLLDGSATGNLHARARNGRYELAQTIAEEHDCSEIAVAHTADDQAETILYRLLASPGRRALVGMQPRRGNIVRPLLGVRREELRDWCRSRGLTWREDASNKDQRFARTKVRELLADAEEVHPAAVANVLATASQLRDEDEALRAVVSELLAEAVGADGRLSGERLAAMPTPLAALTLRMYVEEKVGAPVPAARHALPEVLRLCKAGGSHEIQFEGATLTTEYGEIEVGKSESAEAPEAIELPVPGKVKFGEWLVSTGKDVTEGAVIGLVGEWAIVHGLTVRAREEGDSIRPAGMDGNKSLQDLFVDNKVPERLRAAYPVVCSGDEIIWVPGLAVSGDHVALDSKHAVTLSAISATMVEAIAAAAAAEAS